MALYNILSAKGKLLFIPTRTYIHRQESTYLNQLNLCIYFILISNFFLLAIF